jgi:cell division protein FtsQ
MATRALSTPQALPADVRWMNALAGLLALLAAVLALLLAALWVARQPLWTLRAISLHGDVEHQSVAAIRTQVLPHLRGNFLTLDLAQARARFEALPWVREARVERVFPNRLRVTLREHEPLAWWQESGGTRAVSTTGEVFDITPDDPAAERWSTLAGPGSAAPAVVAMYQRLLPLVARLGRDIDELQLSERGSWRLLLDNGAVLELGRGDELALARLQRFVATQPALRARFGPRDIVTADLRYPHGYAVQLRGVSTDIDPAALRRAAARGASPSPTPLR